MGVNERKTQLRQAGLEFRQSLPEMTAQRNSRRIWLHLREFPLYQRANAVMFYVALAGEVDTKPMIEQSLRMGKRIIVPVTDRSAKALMPCEIFGLDELVEGVFNVLEPRENLRRVVLPEEIDLIVVPGAAFDRKGGRIGFGAGYYDRFLSQPQLRASTVALSFEGQIMDEVPQDDHDVSVEWLITEQGVFQCNREPSSIENQENRKLN
ncbi:MAG: 5-formyltetrahydrofolate cyclo-ligase [Limnochordia bacterium]|jgi:5-formyltetrahydrofolate cyclo-ligase|nr:5-formyltetrahydrofolate cyclo-ligase [Limnochordia bacterium]MDD2628865.1 5-formyltetrahydrofolate cyclo-ligase [Limnochordia bacterium]MDD4517004.1 5-formyltetrahydrofolate cyclo-ligase [Limnochordia bacterium]